MSELIDALKTYVVIVVGFIANVSGALCEAAKSVTIILVLILTIARLINDVPKAVQTIKTLQKNRRKNRKHENS
jgi:uncharacterized membrane protein